MSVPGILAVDHHVADGHRQRAAAAGVQQLARPERDDRPALGPFLGAVGQHDAAAGALFGFHRFNNNAIVQRTQTSMSHDVNSFRYGY